MNLKFLEPYEKYFAVYGLLYFSRSLNGFLPSLDSPSRYLVWLLATIFVIVRWQNSLYAARRNIFLIFVCGLSASSFLWSERPDLTMLQVRDVIQMSTFGLYLASRFSLKAQIDIVTLTCQIILLLCLFNGVAQPSKGIHQGGPFNGAWKGIYGHKNILGDRMVLTSVIFFILTINNKRYFSMPYICLFLTIVVTLLSTSKTALITSIVLILMISLYRNYRWQGKKTIVFLDILVLICGSIAIFLFYNWAPFIISLGRDPTLTGRTLIWEVAFKHIVNKPLLGFGRGVFWGPGSPYALEAGSNVSAGHYIVPHSHNGVVDMMLEIGILGLIFFFLSLILAYKKALKQAYQTKKPENFLPLGFLMFIIMYNITESLILNSINWIWVLYIATSLASIKSNKS